MEDATTTLEYLKNEVAEFVAEREWNQFHNPKNLSMDIAVEAAELMEKFLWCGREESREELAKNRQEVENEFADVLIGLLAFANDAQIDVVSAFEHKLASTKAKYPVGKSRGKSTKYDRL